MLQKPGEARHKPSPSQTRRRRVVEEDLEDVVRRLQRLPPNKACADCSSKLTQCVNLNHGTFVCMACSGVHREFNHKIKGIGHSSFTAEEVAKLRHPTSGNEAVNARFLANYVPQRERMKPPQNNTDLQLLRAWIQRKYVDKAWCNDAGKAEVSSPKPPASSKSSGTSKSKTTKREKASKKSDVPRVNSPGPNASSSKPPPDPFGFDTISSAAPVDTSWDAFGGSSTGFSADFGNVSAPAAPAVEPPAPPPPPPAAPPAPAFQADFGSFSQPTMVSMPPPTPAAGQFSQTPQQPQQQQQPSFQANFDQASMVANQVPGAQGGLMGGASNMMGGQANQMNAGMAGNGMNFGQFPQQQQPPPPAQTSGFADFSSIQPQMGQQQQQHPQQPNQHAGQAPNVQIQGGGAMNQGNLNFGNVHQQQQTSMENEQSGFANFSSMPTQQQTQQQVDKTQAEQTSFGNFSNIPMQPQMVQQQPPHQPTEPVRQAPNVQTQGGGAMNQNGNLHFGNMPQQQQSGTQNEQSGFGNFSSIPPQQQNQQQVDTSQSELPSFGNFSNAQVQPQMDRQQQPSQSIGNAPSGQSQGGGVVNQQGNLQFGSMPQQQQINTQNEQSGFTDFSTIQSSQQNEQHVGKSQIEQPSFGDFSNASMQGGGIMNHQDSIGTNSLKTQSSMGSMGNPQLEPNVQAPIPPSPSTIPPVQESGIIKQPTEQMGPTNPNAFRSAPDDKISAFDAFDSLSLEPTPGYMASSVASDVSAASSAKAPSTLSQYKEGQKVIYTNSNGSCEATISKVHYDDELHPYYTIALAGGKEKQTDDAHLSLQPELKENGNAALPASLGSPSGLMMGGPGSIESAPSSVNNSIALMQETISMLQNLNPQQLMQVQQFISSMKVTQQVTPDLKVAAQGNVNDGLNGGKSINGSNQSGLPMGISANTQIDASSGTDGFGHQPSNHGNATNNSMSGMNPPPSVQQNQFGGMHQPMGVTVQPSLGQTGANLNTYAGTAIGSNYPTAPMGTTTPGAAPAAPPPSLPPVEKEGNPFDFY